MLRYTHWALPGLALALLACGPRMEGFDALAHDATIDGTDAYFGFEAGPDVQLLGRVCRTAAQCDDGVPCTDDICNSDNRCINLPNNNRCDNSVYCSGGEICDMHRGCIHGHPISCDDGYVCTEDRCDEATHACVHTPLDRDHDRDPDDHCHAIECGDAGVPEPGPGVTTPCWRGHDCDDLNARVSSLVPEICGDHIDNNCNGFIDDAEPGGCVRAPYDRCDQPLDVSAGGVFTLDLGSAQPDYTFSCAAGIGHDMVARLHLTEAHDVELRAASNTTLVGMLLQTSCGSVVPSGTLQCSFALPAVIRRHSLPAGDYFIIVGDSGPDTVDLTVHLTPATPQPTNIDCASATVVPSTGGSYNSDLIGATDHASTMCGGTAPDVFYTFTLTQPQDVTLQLAGNHSSFLDLSLTSTCARMPTMIRCDSGSSVQFTSHQLPAGTYFVIVEAFDPVPFDLQVSFAPPTAPPPGDTCAMPLPLVAGTPVTVSTANFENDYRLACQPSGRDTVFQFTLSQRSDVMIDAAASGFDYFGVSIASDCPGTMDTTRTCTNGNNPRVFALGLDPGTYYAITKPTSNTDYRVTLSTFAPIPVMAVTGNDTCATAFAVPPGRGYFSGNTSTLHNDYSSPCAGTTPAPDAVYSLHLGSSQRVTIAVDSSFFNVVWITQADRCNGTAPMGTGSTCTLGTHSILDNTLAAGDYFIFIDGLSTTNAGAYTLLVQAGP